MLGRPVCVFFQSKPCVWKRRALKIAWTGPTWKNRIQAFIQAKQSTEGVRVYACPFVKVTWTSLVLLKKSEATRCLWGFPISRLILLQELFHGTGGINTSLSPWRSEDEDWMNLDQNYTILDTNARQLWVSNGPEITHCCATAQSFSYWREKQQHLYVVKTLPSAEANEIIM